MRLRTLARPCGRAYDLSGRLSLEHRLRLTKRVQYQNVASIVAYRLPLRFCSNVPNLLADIVPTAKDTQKVTTALKDSKETVTKSEESDRPVSSKSKRKKLGKKKKAATQKPQVKEEASGTVSKEPPAESPPVKNVPKVSKVEETKTTTSEVASEVTSPQPSTAPSLPDDTERITLLESKSNGVIETLHQISKLQTQLPVVSEITSLLSELRSNSFEKGNELFELYRKYGNPSLDEKFLLPGVLACCEANKPKEAIKILKDILNQGRHVESSTFHKVLETCDETSAGEQVIELWQLMNQANVPLCLDELDTILKICTRAHYLEGAIKVLKELRQMRPISIHTYMHWLYRSSIVWRADIFLDLLVEMRLAGVEPVIPSLTSLESERKDPALTVMEGVRAVGLDPCYAMASVYSSLQWQVYGNGPAGLAITSKSIKSAKKKFGDLNPIILKWPTQPIPQVLETQAAGLILQQETFQRLHISQVYRIEKLLKMLPITTNMTINLRKQLQRMSLLVNTHRVRMNMHRISKEYNDGKSLIDLGNAHNYPPVSLMRVILAARGFSTFKIRNALREPNHHLSSRDCEELKRASKNDSIHRSDPSLEARSYNVQSLEATLKAYLHCHGIRFKTEEELGTEQEAKYGRRIISPDILFLDPVIINDTPIRWMDAKNYYGAQIVSKRLIMNQLSSYVKEWGPGAILFGMGFSDKFSVPGVLCLDTAPFPTTAFGKFQLQTKAFLFRIVNQLRWKQHLGSDLSAELAAAVQKEESEKEKSD